MNLMLATLTAKDRFDTFLEEAAAERQVATETTRRTGRIGLRNLAVALGGYLRLTGRGLGA